MVNLLGANPAIGVLLGLALIGLGSATGRVPLAVAGGVLLVVSGLRVLRPSDDDSADDDQHTDERRR